MLIKIQIKKVIFNFAGDFQIKDISPNVIQIISEDLGFSKFIIFEPEEIYRNTKDTIAFMEEIGKIDIKPGQALRVPFFAGCSGYDLSNFLMGNNLTLDKDFDIPINFSTLPVDFNLYGIQRFVKYLEIIHNQQPVFKGSNNFQNYLSYFIDKIEAEDWKINTVIPIKIRAVMPTELKALDKLFEALKEAKGDIK